MPSLASKILVCAILAALPMAAQTLSAQPAAVMISYTVGTPAPEPVEIIVAASNGASPALSATLLAASTTPAGLFHFTISGSNINVGVDRGVMSTLLSVFGLYTATLQVSAAGFPTLNIPITLDMGGIAVSLAAAPTSLTFNMLTGPSSQTVSVTASSSLALALSITATTTTGGNWLAVSAGSNYTPATLTVTATPGKLSPGTYMGSITITPASGGVLTIPVTMQAGPSTPLTASPTALAFNYSLYAAPPSVQTVHLTSNISKTTYTARAYSTGTWLLVNGATQTGPAALPADLHVSVNPASLSGGSYQGSITVVAANGSTQQITVMLSVSGVVSAIANPTALTFVSQAGAAPPARQIIYISGSSLGTYTAAVSAGAPWLSISSASGHTPVQLSVIATPGSLGPGTYSGAITVSNGSRAQNIQVSLIVSVNPVLITSTGAVFADYLSGNPSPTLVDVPVFVSSGLQQSFTLGPGLPSWLQVTPSGPYKTPASLILYANPTALPSGLYLANISLIPSAGGVSLSLPVLLNVSGVLSIVPAVPSLSFSVAAGAPPQTQTLAITAAQSTAFTATSSGGNWLSVTPGSGLATAANTMLTVSADAHNLSAGTYQGMLSLTTSGGIITQVPVTLTVGAAGVLTLSASTMAFDYTQGSATPANQTVQVMGSGSFTASAATADEYQWLSVSPTSGAGGTNLTVAVDPGDCAPGTHTGTITLTPAGGAPQKLAVTFTVSAAMAVAPDSLAFTYRALDDPPAAQTLSLTTTGPAMTYTTAASSSGWLSCSPASGSTPGTLTITADPTNMDVGTYAGTITIAAAAGTPHTVNVTLSITAPPPVLNSIVNAASYAPGGLAPGELIAVFGDALGPSEGKGADVDSAGMIEPLLSNTQLTFNGYAAPLLYSGMKQVTAVVPYEIAGASDVTVVLTYGKVKSNSITLPVVSSAPGIFSADASGMGPGAILDLNYNLVTTANPAARGDIIIIFATGEGLTTPSGTDGKVAGSLPLPAPNLATGLLIGNQPAQVLYVGAAPGLIAGALQINARIPDAAPSGANPVVLRVGDYSSQPGITVAVK